MKLTDTSPNIAIIESWKRIEEAVRELAKATNTNPLIVHYGLERFPDRIVGKLSHIVKPYKELEELRNRLTHYSDSTITVDTARRYINLSEFVEHEIRNTIPD